MEIISRDKLNKSDLKSEETKILDTIGLKSLEDEDEFYRPAIELLDSIYSSIIDQ